MTMPRYFITRELTDEERAHLDVLLQPFDAHMPPPPPPNPPASAPLPGDNGNLLNGNVPYGAVTVKWRAGVPQIAYLTDAPEEAVEVPPRFWSAVMQHTRQDQWAPFVYIAFLESRYREDAAAETAAEDSYGAMQVNVRAHPEYTREQMILYPLNLDAAQAIYNREGYGAWFNSATILGLI
jgi:hypothetical protein